jgi:hypothetical protein
MSQSLSLYCWQHNRQTSIAALSPDLSWYSCTYLSTSQASIGRLCHNHRSDCPLFEFETRKPQQPGNSCKKHQAKAITLDLSLPPTCPALCAYGDFNWDQASFALYTLIDLSPGDLNELLSVLDKEWLEDSPVPIVRTPRVHNLVGKTLRDVVQAHVDLNKKTNPVSGGQAKGVLNWHDDTRLDRPMPALRIHG